MRILCLISFIVGIACVLFGIFCMGPYLPEDFYIGPMIGGFSLLSGSFLWGTSLIAFVITSKKNKPD